MIISCKENQPVAGFVVSDDNMKADSPGDSAILSHVQMQASLSLPTMYIGFEEGEHTCSDSQKDVLDFPSANTIQQAGLGPCQRFVIGGHHG